MSQDHKDQRDSAWKTVTAEQNRGEYTRWPQGGLLTGEFSGKS